MPSDASILVYQSLDNLEDKTFDHGLIQWLSENKSKISIYSFDSLSDASTRSYVDRFLNESDRVLVVALFDQAHNHQGLSPVLKTILRKEGCSVFSLQGDSLIKKIPDSQYFEDEESLKKAINKWIQGNVK